MYRAREMMFGFRDQFSYSECSACGSVQIDEVPTDLARYYPTQYYSFAPANLPNQPDGCIGKLRARARRLRDSSAALGNGISGKLLYSIFPDPQWRNSLRTLFRDTFPPEGPRPLGITAKSRILDVGCGSGALLLLLAGVGFRTVVGVDPYIRSDISYHNGVRILKCSIHEVDGVWDVIMFHHSFEHLPDPLESLQSASRLLSEKGLCLIRTPTVSSDAWDHYRAQWVQLDPPRHLLLQSVRSMRLLATQAGFRVERVVYDSTGFQFWGSEQYLRDIPLVSDRSYRTNPKHSIFTEAELNDFEGRARVLNAQERGDQAAFYLRK